MSQLQTVDQKQQAANSLATLLQSPKMLAQIKLAVPKHVTPERIARLALTQCRQNPDLFQCTQPSLIGSMMQAAQLGLEPGVRGQCWLIPFDNYRRDLGRKVKEATFIIGYMGLCQLAYRSGYVAGIQARCVYEGDAFEYDYAQDHISHKELGEKDPAKITHAYAIIHIKGGGRVWDVMTRAEIDAVRERSRARSSGPWVTDYAEMARKTVFRRACKYAPASSDLNRALDLDDRADRGESQAIDVDFDLTDEPEAPQDNAGDEGPTVDVPPATKTDAKQPAGRTAKTRSGTGGQIDPILDRDIKARAATFIDPSEADWKIRALVEESFGPLGRISPGDMPKALEMVRTVNVRLGADGGTKQ